MDKDNTFGTNGYLLSIVSTYVYGGITPVYLLSNDLHPPTHILCTHFTQWTSRPNLDSKLGHLPVLFDS